MGGEVWTNNDGEKLYDPWPHRVPVHGAHRNTRPTMLVLDGRVLHVKRVVDT